MVYICRLKPKLGHLNLEACVEKNIPPGPLLGRLKAGEDVTLPDGTLVRAKDVKSPDEPGAVFIGTCKNHLVFVLPAYKVLMICDIEF